MASCTCFVPLELELELDLDLDLELELELELTRLDGHLIVMKEGVRNAKKAQSQVALSGAISPANDRFCRHRAKTQRIAREFGCHETSILSWIRAVKGSDAAPAAALQNSAALNAAERQELIELRRKLRQVQLERDILAKATAWFAGKSEQTPTAFTR